VKLRALESLAKSKRAEFERLQARLQSVRTTCDAHAIPVEVQIVWRARPSSEKAWPKVGMVTLLAMTGSLLMGLAFAITRELFGMARKEPVAAATGAGALPTTAAANARTAARSIPSLARQLSAMAAGRSGLRTLLTTERPRLAPLTQVAGERVGMTTCVLQAPGDPARLEP
jgi:polysaccharide biosynthesis transport protein